MAKPHPTFNGMNLSKTTSRRTMLVTVLTGLVALSPVLLIYFTLKSLRTWNFSISAPLIENTATVLNQGQTSSPVQVDAGLPLRLKIPKINVDSAIEHVGLTSEGAIGVPKERENVAWFDTGPRPGDNGSAIIVGHYGINNKKTSAFDNLHRLRKGDKLYVEDDKGVITTFVVRGNRRYDPKADASDVFDSSDGKSHLNLITCEGTWDESTQQYSKRLVVFTDRE